MARLQTAENRPAEHQRRGRGSIRAAGVTSAPSSLLLAAAVLVVFLAAAAEAYVLRGCYGGQADNALFDEGRCSYGWEVDACGRKSCTKGPGDICGGKNNRYGICGEGLMCSNCNRCQGCSLKTFECYDDRTCISSFK